MGKIRHRKKVKNNRMRLTERPSGDVDEAEEETGVNASNKTDDTVIQGIIEQVRLGLCQLIVGYLIYLNNDENLILL